MADREKLLDDYQLKTRKVHGRTFIVEGRHTVETLLISKLEIRSLLLTVGQHRDMEIQIGDRAPVLRLPKEEMEQLLGFPFHRGVVACGIRPQPQPLSKAVSNGVVVVCPEIADESNLGSILRNAAAFGAAAVGVQVNKGADVYSRKTIRASSGTLFQIPVAESPDLIQDVIKLKNDGFTIMGAVVDDKAIRIRQLPKHSNIVLVLGSESKGLNGEWQSICDIKVTIPLNPKVDSLNVASSSAIILYELLTPNFTPAAVPTRK